VAAPGVARRTGHGVGVLLKVYAGCIDGDEDLVNDPSMQPLVDVRLC
jgi:hypothetical protein